MKNNETKRPVFYLDPDELGLKLKEEFAKDDERALDIGFSGKVIIQDAPITGRMWKKGDVATVRNGKIRMGGCWFNLDKRFKVTMPDVEISLPSDKDIKTKAFAEYDYDVNDFNVGEEWVADKNNGFQEGAKWMRNKLQGK